MKLGPGGHRGTHGRDHKGRNGVVHPILSTMLPLVHPSDPHKVAPGTHFNAMKYCP